MIFYYFQHYFTTMSINIVLFILSINVVLYYGIPVNSPKPGVVAAHPDNDGNNTFYDELNQKEYSEFLHNVVTELHKDKDFQDRLLHYNGSMSQEDYADSLNYASPLARSKLDEIKRREIERLNNLELQLKILIKREKHLKKDQNQDSIQNKVSNDRMYLHSKDKSEFTKQDLVTLIANVQHDIKMTDTVREKSYRRHEWRKERKDRLEINKILSPEARKRRLEEYELVKKNKLKHDKINEPGSEEQMKEIWKNVDHLDSEYFNVKTLFNLHDINQDGHWDIEEIEAIILPAMEKVYNRDGEPVDMEEKYHELMKMRQHFMDKTDANKDQIVTFKEFEHYSKSQDFKKNSEWKLTEEDDQLRYTEEDMKMFEAELENIQKSIPQTKPESQNLDSLKSDAL